VNHARKWIGDAFLFCHNRGGRACEPFGTPTASRIRSKKHQEGGIIIRVLVTVTAVCCLLVATLGLTAAEKKDDKKTDKKWIFIDLQPKANHKLADDVQEGTGGNDLKEVKTGEQTLADVRFKIGEKYIQLGSTMAPDKPEKVEGIKVDRKFTKLHLLHATEWAAENDTIIGEYTVTWDDDTSTTIPIRYGKDILDWWYDDSSPESSEAKVAWKGDNELAKGQNKKIRLYRATWENSKPELKVKTIDISSTKQTQAAPFCVAITAEE
jgi:hypothetical protein